MGQSNVAVLKHTSRALVCGVLAATALATASPASAAVAAPCADVDVAPTSANVDVIRAAVLCLTNADRTRLRLPVLHENAKLRKAALAHTSDMVRGGYFAHTQPDGDTFVDRILAARYVRKNDGWKLGENLAWGVGSPGTARGVHDAWMKSSGHRANIVNASYREIGIGIRVGIPTRPGVGATFTTDFGAKA